MEMAYNENMGSIQRKGKWKEEVDDPEEQVEEDKEGEER